MCRSESERGGVYQFKQRGKTGEAGQPGLLKRLWHDDRGAVLATEWVLITTLFLIGLVPALLIIRHGLMSKFLDISGATLQLDESYGFTGAAVGDDRDRIAKGHKADPLGTEPSDPVLEEAARVSQRDVARDTNRQNERRQRARGYAFTAGSLFLEDRHLEGKGGRVPAIPSHSVPAD
jgi:hypothetical protein